MTLRLVTAISVTHHWNHCWIRRTIATSARAYAVYRQNPVSSSVWLSQKATPARSATAAPGLLTGLQDALNVGHDNGSPSCSDFIQPAYSSPLFDRSPKVSLRAFAR